MEKVQNSFIASQIARLGESVDQNTRVLERFVPARNAVLSGRSETLVNTDLKATNCIYLDTSVVGSMMYSFFLTNLDTGTYSSTSDLSAINKGRLSAFVKVLSTIKVKGQFDVKKAKAMLDDSGLWKSTTKDAETLGLKADSPAIFASALSQKGDNVIAYQAVKLSFQDQNAHFKGMSFENAEQLFEKTVDMLIQKGCSSSERDSLEKIITSYSDGKIKESAFIKKAVMAVADAYCCDSNRIANLVADLINEQHCAPDSPALGQALRVAGPRDTSLPVTISKSGVATLFSYSRASKQEWVKQQEQLKEKAVMVDNSDFALATF